MHKRFWYGAFAISAVVAFAAVAPAPRAPLGAPAMSAVKVTAGASLGSGVHIGHGFILTASHVVGQEATASIKTSLGDAVDGVIMWTNAAYDIALIKIDDGSLPAAAHLDCRIPDIGEAIETVGNPLGLEFVTSWGRVSSVSGAAGRWGSAVMVDLSVSPGNSGGPVYDDDDDVVGIVVGDVIAPMGLASSLTGIGVVVPAKTACALLARTH
ncbi:serine protease Do/putative serine protease PepD [Consotaella salsifontis]|uniref:Serine protease Do/putative serine protease PepD n=2 Tax=Consotaella salsifontis TaxID=1365950 RepID=A0A1T4SRJ1_9HYPH|nr:serine protease Do/putative serine protease PepD [Consotaella salsifontis]